MGSIIHQFWAFFDAFRIFGILESQNPEILWNWLRLAYFNVLGIYPTQFSSQKLILNLELPNSDILGTFPKIFGTTENSAEWCIGHLFHLIFVNDIDFVLWYWNIQNFGVFPKMFGYSRYFLKCSLKTWIFQVLSTKSISLTKIKWKRCPIYRN